MEVWERIWMLEMGDENEPELTTTYTDDTLYPMHKAFMTTPVWEMPAKYLLEQAEQGGIPRQLRNYIILNFSRLLEREAFEVDNPNPLPKITVTEPSKILSTFICEKRTYATESMARTVLKRIRNTEQEFKKPIRAYECPNCNGWHLTSLDYDIWKSEQKHKK